jgi:hypothetical protein
MKGVPAMSVHQRTETPPQATNGADAAAAREAERIYGNAFLLSDAPDHRLPQAGMHELDRRRVKTGTGY